MEKELEFTATVYIVKDDKFLFHYHRKYAKWLPPGGHLEPNEPPHIAALREVREEVGLEIEFIAQPEFKIRTGGAEESPRPFLCLLEDVPAIGPKIAHQHYDFTYLAKLAPNQVVILSEDLKWLSVMEIEALVNQGMAFADSIEVAKRGLSIINI